MAELGVLEQDSSVQESPGSLDRPLGGDGGLEAAPEMMEAQWELVAQAIELEREEEAKLEGRDGHEAVAGGAATAAPLGEESNELVDGHEGQPGSAAESARQGVYAEGMETNGSGIHEVEGYVPAVVQEEAMAPLPPAVLTTEEMLDSVDPEVAHLLEIVHGHDDRVRVYNTTAFAWRTICKLEITAADGSTWRGSGAFIGPRTVLTNGHCVFLHNHGGWARQIRVIPGKNGASEPFGAAVSTYYHSVKGWTQSKSSNYDYAVCVLPASKKLGNTVGWMGLANLSFFSLLGLRVNSAGYPGDKPGNYQWWNANNILAVTDRRVYYRIDTFGGQSGSPVWRLKNGNRHIVAVHNTGGTPFNGAVRVNKPVFNNLVKWKNQYT